MKMAVFWFVAPCSLVEVYRNFRKENIMSTKFAIFSEYFLHRTVRLASNSSISVPTSLVRTAARLVLLMIDC
jgi:hypothetical protein